MRVIRYLNLDKLWGFWDYIVYKHECFRCFFSGPRLGHIWKYEGYGNRSCTRCSKYIEGMV